MTEDAPTRATLADHILGLPAGRPAHMFCQKARRELCDGCGKTKSCIVYRVANNPMPRHLWLCRSCRKWFLDEVSE